MSRLADPLLEHYWARTAGYFGWLWAFWAMVRDDRRPAARRVVVRDRHSALRRRRDRRPREGSRVPSLGDVCGVIMRTASAPPRRPDRDARVLVWLGWHFLPAEPFRRCVPSPPARVAFETIVAAPRW